MRTHAIAAVLWMVAATSSAASVATLAARTSVDNLHYSGGFATSGDEGFVGDPAYGVTVTGFASRTLAISGSDYATLDYLSWDGWLSETWDQAQTWSFGQAGADAVLATSGHATIFQDSIICADPYGCGPATEGHHSTNTLALEFTLDAGTDYRLAGSTSGGQWIDLMTWNDLSGSWLPVVYGALATQNTAFDLDGTLAAGLYMLRNNPYMQQGGGPVDVVNTWDAQLTLFDAVAAVPEPPPWLLAVAGATLLAWRRRRART